MIRRTRRTITALAWLIVMIGFVAASARAQVASSPARDMAAVSVWTEADPTVVTIGDPIRCVIHLEYDEGIEILSDLREASYLFNNWWVTDQIWGEPRAERGRVAVEHIYILSTFLTGDFEIPSITVTYRAEDGSEAAVSTPPVLIRVESVLPEDSEAADIQDIAAPVTEGAPGLTREAKAVLFGVPVALAAVLTASVLLFLRRKAAPLPPPRPAHEIAEERFRLLAESEVLEDGQDKAFGAMASDVLREYFLNRYAFDARDLTTGEIAGRLPETDMPRDYQAESIRFLSACDRLKFAGQTLPRETKQTLIDAGTVIVHMTRVRSEEAAPETASEAATEAASEAASEAGRAGEMQPARGDSGGDPAEFAANGDDRDPAEVLASRKEGT